MIRDSILDGVRSDGRDGKTLRPIECHANVIPRVHGSAIFQRGETQALVTITLGTGRDEQRVDGLFDEYSKKFMLDYNFPSFSVGECRPIRGPGRREIGHGALAERSINPVLPDAAIPQPVSIRSRAIPFRVVRVRATSWPPFGIASIAFLTKLTRAA